MQCVSNYNENELQQSYHDVNHISTIQLFNQYKKSIMKPNYLQKKSIILHISTNYNRLILIQEHTHTNKIHKKPSHTQFKACI